ncbi:hypothetical protein EU528_08795 [Candidatus Thorarchaeota archaeon]|nr:MAG: hypothetical protein EU528_08795 [Candidatus Thorarchaeota archaeon]
MESIARTIVSNLHQSYLYRVLTEWFEKDTLQIREDLGISSFSETTAQPVDTFEKVRKHILTKSFQEKEIVEFLMDVPEWVGFRVDTDFIETGEQAIRAAKQSTLSLIWMMLIPRVIIGHTILPEDFENQGIDTLVESLLKSDESRKQLEIVVSTELDRRGFGADFFNISNIIMGFKIPDTTRNERLRALLALVIMKATDCPFNLDNVFTLDEEAMIRETESYIITMHTQNALNNRIKGSSSSRPFDWPLIGTARVFGSIMKTIEVMHKYSSKLTTCSLYKSTTKGKTIPWSESEFISFLLNEIADYYTDSQRTRLGLGKNEELKRFIDILRGESIEITSRVMESSNKSGSLYEELSECKRRARIGERAQITPERRFRIVLSTLKNSLEDVQTREVSSEEIIDQIAIAFDAITQVIAKHEDSLGSEVDKFAEELCFEISFRILDLLGLGNYLPDLPWVARFIAEESTMIDISSGEISKLQETQRIKRIVSAFAGGVSFLVLQHKN